MTMMRFRLSFPSSFSGEEGGVLSLSTASSKASLALATGLSAPGVEAE